MNYEGIVLTAVVVACCVTITVYLVRALRAYVRGQEPQLTMDEFVKQATRAEYAGIRMGVEAARSVAEDVARRMELQDQRAFIEDVRDRLTGMVDDVRHEMGIDREGS